MIANLTNRNKDFLFTIRASQANNLFDICTVEVSAFEKEETNSLMFCTTVLPINDTAIIHALTNAIVIQQYTDLAVRFVERTA